MSDVFSSDGGDFYAIANNTTANITIAVIVHNPPYLSSGNMVKQPSHWNHTTNTGASHSSKLAGTSDRSIDFSCTW